jgi:hypothetical protein
MSRLELWLLGVGLGLVTLLAWTLFPASAIAVVLLVVPMERRWGLLPVLSGMLTGFGSILLLLMGAESASGGVLDDAEFWYVFGVVPVLLGLALLVRVVTTPARVDRTPDGS